MRYTRRNSVLAGLIASLLSPASVVYSQPYKKLQGSDLTRMRQDMSRIGNDFRKSIIDYQQANEKQS